MKIFSTAGFFTLLAIVAVTVGAQQAYAAEQPIAEKPQAVDGTIDLIRRNTEVDCTFKFVTGQYQLSKNDDGCSNDVNYSFRLNNVPSASTFILADSGECKQDENFWFEFKTIKYETTTDVIHLEDIPRNEEGAVIVPGVRLIKKVIKSGDPQIGGKLSCLKIIRSE